MKRALIAICIHVMIYVMTGVRRVTANLPADLLEEAMATSGKGITETLVDGLRRVRAAGAYGKAMALKGRLALDVDLETSRERRRGGHLDLD